MTTTLFNGSSRTGAVVLSGGKPSATFPAAVAGDAQLAIAVNREQTTLALPVAVTDTSMTVMNTAGIVIWSLLSIDNEIVQVNNPPAGNVVPIARGFDGTTPAIHLVGATVAGLIVDYHHNTLVSEIEAIEAALGPNLNKIPTSAFLISTNFQFPPQTPGGNLTGSPGGTANVITLTPVPQGVNGNDPNHYLYISGGTGTAEAVKIIGGTAVSGAASGTVIVNCINNHSGAWTIQTATAGVQEAIVKGGGTYVQVWVPAGVYNFYAPVYIDGDGVAITGAGFNVTTIWQQTPNTSCFIFDPHYYGILTGMQLNAAGTQTSGYAIDLNSQNGALVSQILVNNFANGIRLTNNSATRIAWCSFAPVSANGDGIFITGNSTNVVRIDQCDVEGSNGNYRAGLHVQGSGGLSIYNSKFLQAIYGALFDPGSGQGVGAVDLSGCDFDSNTTTGMWLHPSAGATINEIRMDNCWFSSNHGGDGFLSDPVTAGVVNGVLINASVAYINGRDGFRINAGSNIRIQNCVISDNGKSIAGNGVTVLSGAVNVKVQNNHIGNNLDGNVGTNSQLYGVYWPTGSSGQVTGNLFTGHATAPMFFVPAASDSVMAGNNLGVDDQSVVIASAASITIPQSGIVNLQITGTTTITNIADPWQGCRVTLYKADAGTVTVGGGTGNIPGTHTLSQYISLTLFFGAGNYWY